MRSSKGTPKPSRKEVETDQPAMTAGELAEYVKKSLITAYTNLVNGAVDFDNVVAYFAAVTDLNDALNASIDADPNQEAKLRAAFFDAVNCDEVTRQRLAFFNADIQTHIKDLLVEHKNVEVAKGVAKIGRDVKRIRRQVCTVVFSDDDKSVTCVQSELKNAEVLAVLKKGFDDKVKELCPQLEAAGMRRSGGK